MAPRPPHVQGLSAHPFGLISRRTGRRDIAAGQRPCGRAGPAARRRPAGGVSERSDRASTGWPGWSRSGHFARRGPAADPTPIGPGSRRRTRPHRSPMPCPRATPGRAAAPPLRCCRCSSSSRCSPPWSAAASRPRPGRSRPPARPTPGRSSRSPATSRRPPAPPRPSPASRTSPRGCCAAYPTHPQPGHRPGLLGRRPLGAQGGSRLRLGRPERAHRRRTARRSPGS